MADKVQRINAVLLDIEGTVSSISFVHNVLFPYAVDVLPGVLSEKWDDDEFKPYKDVFPEEARSSPTAFVEHVKDLTRRDVKIAYLKNLQGYLWKIGYASGAIKSPIYPDVAPAIQSWRNSRDLKIFIYSSGSVAAQKLFFQYTDFADQADLRGWLSDYFDTVNAGPKTEASSYTKIAEQCGIPVDGWLFLSDNAKEVEAAKSAGMSSAIIVRPGNAPLTAEQEQSHDVVLNGFNDKVLEKYFS